MGYVYMQLCDFPIMYTYSMHVPLILMSPINAGYIAEIGVVHDIT